MGCLHAAQARARQWRVACLVSNPIGGTGTVWWPGNSGVIDRDGSVRAWMPGRICMERMQPGFVAADVHFG